MYKWVDEKGVTHFSGTPPPGDAKASRVTPRVVPPAKPPKPEDAAAWRAKEAEFRRRQAERGRQEEAEAQAKAKRERECVRERQRLAALEEPRRVYRRDDQGNRVYLDDAEREKAIAERRLRVREACG